MYYSPRDSAKAQHRRLLFLLFCTKSTCIFKLLLSISQSVLGNIVWSWRSISSWLFAFFSPPPLYWSGFNGGKLQLWKLEKTLRVEQQLCRRRGTERFRARKRIVWRGISCPHWNQFQQVRQHQGQSTWRQSASRARQRKPRETLERDLPETDH